VAQDQGLNNLSQQVFINYRDTTFPTWTQDPPNTTAEYGQPFTLDLNATDLLPDVYFMNDSRFKINSGNGLIQNNGLLDLNFIYTLEVGFNDTTGNAIRKNITITVKDTIPPTWNISASNQYVFPGQTLNMTVHATDDSNISAYFINDTYGGIFNINPTTGVFTNITGATNETLYIFTVSANDTVNNIVNETFWVFFANSISNFTIEILSVDSNSLIVQVRADEGNLNDATCNLTVLRDGIQTSKTTMTDAETTGVYSSDFGALATDNYGFIIDCSRGWKTVTLLNTTAINREAPQSASLAVFGLIALAIFMFIISQAFDDLNIKLLLFMVAFMVATGAVGAIAIATTGTLQNLIFGVLAVMGLITAFLIYAVLTKFIKKVVKK